MMIWLVLALVAATPSLAFERTSDDWLRMVSELQQYEQRLDRDDRKFLRQMMNVLTLSDDAYPTPAQQRWLLDIKRRMER